MEGAMQPTPTADQPFISDIKALRDRARKNIEQGAVTSGYVGDVDQAIEILQSVLATEIVCVLRYTMNAIAAGGLNAEAVKSEFATHAGEEQQHMMQVAERINQLGGTPDFSPDTLTKRSASQYIACEDLIDMIRENLVAERIAVEHYSDLIRYFGDNDPGTRIMLESILRTEEEHADDMRDLLIAHQGEPAVKSNGH
jgi:bacterioferritin